MAEVSRSTRLVQIHALSTGLTTYAPTLTVSVDGTTYTMPEVVSVANGLLAAALAVSQAKVSYEAAIAAEKKLFASNGIIITATRASLAFLFNSSQSTLEALAITQRKTPKPLSTEALAARAAKAKATREARGTTSKKQKATIVGNVTGVSIVPITASSPAATPAAPVVTTPVTPAVSTTVSVPAIAPHG